MAVMDSLDEVTGDEPLERGWGSLLSHEQNTLVTRPGKLSHNYGKSQFLMGKSTISMVIFNSYVKLPENSRPGKHTKNSGKIHHFIARFFSTISTGAMASMSLC